MSSAPAITVIMPVFNAGPFLAPAIESLFAQTFADFELVIVDDASSDGSVEAIRQFARSDSRLRSFFQRENQGISATRNFAIEQARGEYIAFLNHDDIALPERLARQLEFLQRNEDVDLVGSAIENIGPAGESLNTSPMPESDLEIHWLGLLDCPVRQSALMMRRDVFTRRGIRYDPDIISYSDYDFVARAIRSVHAANLPEALTQYRKHPQNTSRVRWEMFVESGARIAHDAIRFELPDCKIDIEQVAEMRAVIFGYRAAASRNSLAVIKRAVACYLDLFESFSDRHRDHPLMARLHRPDAAEIVTLKSDNSSPR
ncbi:MAG: glycosyltransferase family A protein [Spartobacteria bacterium]